MSACDDVRPLLGELLAGALPRDRADEALAHVRECAACGVELGELSRLEEDLGALAVRPARAGFWRGVVGGAAVAASLLLAVAHVLPDADGVRVLAGRIDRKNSTLTIRTDRALVALADGSRVDGALGASLALEGPRRVVLERGAATFDVVPAGERFSVRTPRGLVTVLGTRFQVGIGEAVMNGDTVRGALAGAAVTIVVASGVVLFKSADDGSEATLRAGDRAVARQNAPVDVTRAASVKEPEAELRRENEALKQELAATRKKSAALEERVAVLASEVATHASAPAQGAAGQPQPGAPPLVAKGARPRVAFGSYADMKELAKTDWDEAAGAVRAMHAQVKDLYDKIRNGVDIPPAVGIALAKENSKLQKIAFALNGKIATHATGNGEFTHPIVIANLIAKHLDLAGSPLDEAQAREIVRIGDEYDARWKALQAGYAADALVLEKVLDELELKKFFVDRIYQLLTPDQARLVIDPAVRDVFSLDIYSPLIMLIGRARAITSSSREGLKKNVASVCVDTWEIPDERKPEVELATDELFRALDAKLAPVPQREAGLFKLDDAIAAGRALVGLEKTLLRTLPADSDAAKAIRESSTVFVPRVIVPAPPKK